MVGQDVLLGEKTTSSPPPQKRVLPARERRESAAKRRASSPIAVLKQASTPKKSTPTKATPKTVPTKYKKRKSLPEVTPTRRLSTPIAEEGLPNKVSDARPLPTVLQPQSSRLSSKEYQDIAESAVLAASMHRSRLKWLGEGIFEKYWTKPSKKKGMESLANNPDLKTMQKLGSSAIVIGPHSFDAIIYTVRDNVAYKQPNLYPQRPVALQPGFQNYLPMGPQITDLQASHVINPVPHPPPVEMKQEQPLPSANTNFSTQSSKVPGPPSSQAAASTTSQPAAAQSGPDPVIRMLATRAATNPALKALMKVVASSKASQEQLKLFQSHIDELNVIIRQQEEPERPPSEPQNTQLDQGLSRPSQLDGPSEEMSPIIQPSQQGNPRPPAYPIHTQLPGFTSQALPRQGAKIGPLGPPLNTLPYAQYPPPQQRLPMPESRIKAIVLELTTPASSSVPASQDRYLFPEYAVLDTPISGQGLEMVCSFFVVRKGSELLAMQFSDTTSTTIPVGGLTRWKVDEEYYQPITITMKTSQHRILETIARAAKPLSEVQAKMKEIMQTKTRVKDEWLVMRLPREKGVSVNVHGGHERGFVDSAVEMEDEGGSGDEDDGLKAFYGI